MKNLCKIIFIFFDKIGNAKKPNKVMFRTDQQAIKPKPDIRKKFTKGNSLRLFIAIQTKDKTNKPKTIWKRMYSRHRRQKRFNHWRSFRSSYRVWLGERFWHWRQSRKNKSRSTRKIIFLCRSSLVLLFTSFRSHRKQNNWFVF